MHRETQRPFNFTPINWGLWAVGSITCLILSLALAWISTGYVGIQGWGSFFAVLLLASGLLVGSFWLLRGEGLNRWLVALVIGAALLRLAVSVYWFVSLPVMGHGSPEELAGYVMADASARDQAAWELSQADIPLRSAFLNIKTVDQYGGMLFLSSFVYRYSGIQAHYPLIVVVITSAFSALVVLFTWAFARRAWEDKVGWLAAWILTLYPEAILLGSSQMREAFIMTLTVVAFFGLLHYLQEHTWTGLTWMAVALLLFVPLSPLFTVLIMIMLVLAALPFRKELLINRSINRSLLWIITSVLIVVVLVGMWLALKQFVPPGMNNPIAMMSWWVRKSAGLQAYLSRLDSGWMQKIFRTAPEWSHVLILLGYGVVQPFLPAAIVASSQASIWHWIAFWRALGWALLLPFLIYAPLRAFRQKDDRGFALMMGLIVWIGILVASFRGGGDMWDNPRYRVAFIGLQVSLAAWVWIEQRRAPDPWFRRAIVAIGAILLWFFPWYLRRYYGLQWPVEDLFLTLGLGICTAALYWIWDWARERKKRGLGKANTS